jgi:hypothetical protein
LNINLIKVKFIHFSPRLVALRGLGVTLTILGGITLLYAVFEMQAIFWIWDPGPGVEGMWGEDRLLQSVVGFVGVVLIFLGFKSYWFIPYSEREM